MFIFYQGLPQDARKNHVTSCFKCMIVNMSFVNISRFLFFEDFSQPDILKMMFFCACCVSFAMVKCFMLFSCIVISFSNLDWSWCLIKICLHSFDIAVVQTTKQSGNKLEMLRVATLEMNYGEVFLMKFLCFCFSSPKTDRKPLEILEKMFWMKWLFIRWFYWM